MRARDLQGYEQTSVLDFAHNRRHLAAAYLLRLAGLAGFTLGFARITRLLRPEVPTSLDTYLGVALPGLPAALSIILTVAVVALVLLLHELIHAGVFYLARGAPPRLGWRGLTIFAAAPEHPVGRSLMVVNALAPFAIISLLGLLLLSVVPASALAWVFIPTVANAAAAGGDFMTLAWLFRLPANVVVLDTGDVMSAWQAV